MSHTHNSIKDSGSSPSNVDVIVACATCSGGGSGVKGTVKKSRYSIDERSAASVPPKVIFTPIPPRDGSKGPFAGKDIKFSEDRAIKVLERLPEDQKLGTEPSGPCAYEVSQYLVCASQRGNLQECEEIEEDLKKCKEKYNLSSNKPS